MSGSDSGPGSMRCEICGSESFQQFTRVEESQDKVWKVFQCGTCRFGWTDPTPGEAELSRYYPVDYLGDVERTILEFQRGDLQQSRSWRRESGKVQVVERYCRGGRLLDVGCAGGSFLLALDSRRWERFGIEPIGEVVDVVSRLAPQIRVEEGTIFSPSLQERSFDVVTFWHVFEHVRRPLEVLKRAQTLLKPGGVVVVSLPNLDSHQARLFTRYWYGLDVPRHLCHFSPRALEILFLRAGLLTPDHLLFCPLANVHQVKHSALRWSEASSGSRIPYYLFKPVLLGLPLLERLTRKYGTLTSIGRKPLKDETESA